MPFPHILNNCSAQAIALPTIFGANFLSEQAALVQNYSLVVPPEYQLRRGDEFGKSWGFATSLLLIPIRGKTMLSYHRSGYLSSLSGTDDCGW